MPEAASSSATVPKKPTTPKETTPKETTPNKKPTTPKKPTPKKTSHKKTAPNTSSNVPKLKPPPPGYAQMPSPAPTPKSVPVFSSTEALRKERFYGLGLAEKKDNRVLSSSERRKQKREKVLKKKRETYNFELERAELEKQQQEATDELSLGSMSAARNKDSDSAAFFDKLASELQDDVQKFLDQADGNHGF